MEGNLGGIYHRLGVYGLIMAAVFGGSALVALALSSFFQRRISEPLIQLATTARSVSEQKDYSLRAKFHGNDEFGELTNAFNGMIEEIQISQSALRESEERFRALADNISQLAWMATAYDTVNWYNRRWYDYTGTTPKKCSDWAGATGFIPITPSACGKKWNGASKEVKPGRILFPARPRRKLPLVSLRRIPHPRPRRKGPPVVRHQYRHHGPARRRAKSPRRLAGEGRFSGRAFPRVAHAAQPRAARLQRLRG